MRTIFFRVEELILPLHKIGHQMAKIHSEIMGASQDVINLLKIFGLKSCTHYEVLRVVVCSFFWFYLHVSVCSIVVHEVALECSLGTFLAQNTSVPASPELARLCTSSTRFTLSECVFNFGVVFCTYFVGNFFSSGHLFGDWVVTGWVLFSDSTFQGVDIS